MLYGGNIGLVVALSILTALTAISTNGSHHGAQAAGIAMLFIYSIIYSATYGYVIPYFPRLLQRQSYFSPTEPFFNAEVITLFADLL